MRLPFRSGPLSIRTLLISMVAGATVPLGACGGGGGGGGGAPSGGANFDAEAATNDTAAGAGLLALDRYGVGELSDALDVDHWRVTLHGGWNARIEVLAARMDQDGWDAAGGPPTVAILAADETPLLRHDPVAWAPVARHDLDVPTWVVPADGDYLVRISSDGRGGGRYAVRVHEEPFTDLVSELEPVGVTGMNNGSGSADPIPASATVRCWTDADRDVFMFDLLEDSVVSVEVVSSRLGVSADDRYVFTSLALITATRSYSGAGLVNNDPGLTVRLPAGTHTIEVAPAATGALEYLLRVRSEPCGPSVARQETEPNDGYADAEPLLPASFVDGEVTGDSDLFTFFGEAGDLVDVEVCHDQPFATSTVLSEILPPEGSSAFLGTVHALHLQRVRAQLRETGVQAIQVRGTGDYVVRLNDPVSAAPESEPNDTRPQADAFLLDRASGLIDVPGDVDVFSFPASAQRLYRIRLLGIGTNNDATAWYGSSLKPRVTVRDATGLALVTAVADFAATTVVQPDGPADPGTPFCLAFVAPANGPVFVEVEDSTGASGRFHSYQLVVE